MTQHIAVVHSVGRTTKTDDFTAAASSSTLLPAGVTIDFVGGRHHGRVILSAQYANPDVIYRYEEQAAAGG